MKNNRNLRFVAFLTTILIGFTMFSMANATSSEENQKAGEAFLAENTKKENITTTASGLQYEILKKGEGDSPSATDTVTVHYKGTTLEGKEFDSSYSRNSPATFPLNRVIAGWTEGLQLMNVGAKYRFFIPSDLAYGERGAGGDIPPNATLIFEVELLKF
jgi:FKBP-type peptidyl-prolyl cis-trans isomerase